MIRRWGHRGVVEAHGFVLRASVLGEAEARRRAIVLAGDGARLYRRGGLLIVVLAAPVLVAAEAAAGEPLCARGAVLSAAPVTARELARLAGEVALDRAARAASHVLLTDGGRVELVALAELEVAPAHEWIDVCGWTAAEAEALGDPPAAPEVPSAVEVRVRARLGVSEASPEGAAVLAALAAQQAKDQRRAASAPRVAGPPSPALAWFRRRLGRLAARRAPGRAIAAARPASPGWFSRVRAWAARRLRATALGAALGRRQARYLLAVQELFERGDIDEALRRALPTTQRGTSSGSPALGLPGRRSSLALRLQPRAGGGGLVLANDWFGEIRTTYRAAATRLIAQGRIDEAAFVLLELLDEPEECVELLEKHGRARVAAELAEARELAPGLIVRLWFLAGDGERAISIARARGAFADAVARLDRSHPDKAALLRLVWADAAAGAGDYATAVEVAWALEDARALVSAWMERAVEAGGVAGARMLARQLVREPERSAEVFARADALWEPERRAERAALGTALTVHQSPGGRVLARPLVRALLRDASRFYPAHSIVQHLVQQDELLRADMPLPKAPPAPAARPAVRHAIARDDVGSLDVRAAVPLPDGRLLLALGELGAAIVNRRGRVVHRFEAPAHDLVVADSGLRALAMARRGEAWTVSQLDLEARRAARWGEVPVGSHAASHDGLVWFVGHARGLWGFDLSRPPGRAAWHVGDVWVGAIQRDRKEMVVMVDPDAEGWGKPELWRYELPSLTLRSRSGPTWQKEFAAVIAHGIDGRIAVLRKLDEERAGMAVVSAAGAALPLPIVGQVSLPRGRIVVVTEDEDRRSVVLLDDAAAERARVELAGAGRIAVHERDGSLAVCDDRGRVVVLSLATGDVEQDLRVMWP